MRTTLDLDEDVLSAARSLAAHDGISLGKAVSVLARRGLSSAEPSARRSVRGFPIYDRKNFDHVITPELVARYRDDD